MSAIEGLSHTPEESESDAHARALSIITTPQLGLGAPVTLKKGENHWKGFVLSIDRKGPESDVIVNWISKPAWAPAAESFGHFKMNQIKWGDRDVWEVDPETVSPK